jgi:hypothetical protein
MSATGAFCPVTATVAHPGLAAFILVVAGATQALTVCRAPTTLTTIPAAIAFADLASFSFELTCATQSRAVSAANLCKLN